MPKNPQPEQQFHVGEKLRVKLHDGRLVDAKIRAIAADDKGRAQLQVDFGYKDAETALIYTSQVYD